MPKVDRRRLIRRARELKDESKEFCKRSRLIIAKSKQLQEIFTESRSTFDHGRRRKHPLKT